ncbi:MAG: PaaI family thioesterase [Rhodoferax sp.]
MTPDNIIDLLNQNRPACVQTLNGRVVEFRPEENRLTMEFEPGLNCCHSHDIVQGGFITSMLDAAMAHLTIATERFAVTLSSIDINVSFLRPSRAGKYRATGAIVKLGRTVGYLRAELVNEKGELTATATSSVYLSRRAKNPSVNDAGAQDFGL